MKRQSRKMIPVLVPVLLLTFALSFPAMASVDVNTRMENSAGWFVHFDADDEDNFEGEVAHLHIYKGELDEARGLIEESLDITLSVENDIGDEIGANVGEVVSWILGAAGAVARNSDGSFDIFFIVGNKEFFGVTTPVVFGGFVPDQIYKPPLPADPLFSVLGIPAADGIGDHFRDRPRA